MSSDFANFFFKATGGLSPYPYQEQLAVESWPETLIVPTGFGKTLAILAAWIWKRSQNDPNTPRRLVYCLPMRTLVEQTEEAAKAWIQTAKDEFGLAINLDVLMGGRADRSDLPQAFRTPDQPAILIGTQDFLVSAALMRGYGASRYRWPIDFAFLHNDAMWVFDEVQLAGAALPTSAQLEAFRRSLDTAAPSRTLWMSATLEVNWLTTVDFQPDETSVHALSDAGLARAERLWKAHKRLSRLDIDAESVDKKANVATYAAAVAAAAREKARARANTIIFLNTVARAQAVHQALSKESCDFQLLLVHSRFRGEERKKQMERLLKDPSPQGRIVVATQALEAGVDVTSAVMITELAPWSSLVQRFGRCNRKGERDKAEIFWIDLPDAAAPPYESPEFTEARAKLASLTTCGPSELANVQLSAPASGHVIRRRDLFDLFDTDPDLSGFDVDVSLYVRDADDTDLRLFWRQVDEKAPPEDAKQPLREELCPAPIGGAKALVKRAKGRAWRWDALVGAWSAVKEDEVFPGLTIWTDSAVGGYSPEVGFDAQSKKPVDAVPVPDEAPSPDSQGDDSESRKPRVTLVDHTAHVCAWLDKLAAALQLDAETRRLLREVALWHDVGKAHDVFKARCGLAPEDAPLAKTRHMNWRTKDERNRKSFRHELASALGYLAHQDWNEDASLAAYLIAAHHGKVRLRLRALPGEPSAPDGKLFARGVWQDDKLPSLKLDGREIPETILDLDIMRLGEGDHGPSWSSRTRRLLKEHGPFRLAWLEALVRIADQRASAEEAAAAEEQQKEMRDAAS